MTQQGTLPSACPAHAGAARSRSQAGRKSTFRPEIQGLRSLAVLMVMSYHIWLGRVSGGVDVFLLISAFLMTLQFVGRYEQGRPMALLKHWLHLFRRLVPAAVTVLVAILAATSVPPGPAGWKSSTRAGPPCVCRELAPAVPGHKLLRRGPQPGQPLPAFLVPLDPGHLHPVAFIFAGAAFVAKFRLRYRCCCPTSSP